MRAPVGPPLTDVRKLVLAAGAVKSRARLDDCAGLDSSAALAENESSSPHGGLALNPPGGPRAAGDFVFAPAMGTMPNRAVLFVDGSNWYHGCKSIGLRQIGRINFARVSRKLVAPRDWVATRYYVGKLPNTGNLELGERQQRFISRQVAIDRRFSCHFGRIEARRVTSPAALELKRFLATMPGQIDPPIYSRLIEIAELHAVTSVMVEKAVDVQLTLDMVIMAERNEYDTAYLLSADGDLTPAVEFVRKGGRRVFVASASRGVRLATACDRFIRLRLDWFPDVMGA